LIFYIILWHCITIKQHILIWHQMTF